MSNSAQSEPRDILTQADAEARSRRVSDAAYVLKIDLQKGSETYRGDVTVTFPLTGDGDTFLDFRGKSIVLLEVNGSEVETDWNGYRLTLPGTLLRSTNTVRISYENEYDHGGDGFHQFKDPEDGEEYLYSNFEPYEAHRLFPCFDQPDIKGTYHLSVTAPAEWEVIANSREESRSSQSDGRVRHEFERTARFSTYLFALIVGPYHVFRDRHGDVDLGLYCRKSMARHLDAEEIFTVSKQGLDFFGAFFDWPYPFGKYDQIFVPEFNSGAMENVGAVTHNEYMVFRDPPTDTQRRGRAETVLHEMAHMWFGDLVTMRWWNDLWLNESFATYMSYLCLDEATRFTSGWQDFASSIKNWAYRQDQLVTTHPIAGDVPDTEATFLNFDGITYGKGASVLKQLVATLGMDGFREGMRTYFRTYAFGNATLAQFLEALEKGSGVALKEWSRLWLETPSLNTIGSKLDTDGDRVSSFTLTQTAPAEYPTIRPHTLEVGFVRDDGGKLLVDVLPAKIDAAEVELEAARGLPAPALVFPNYNDHGYAKVALDAKSVEFVKAQIDRVDDTLLRQLLWASLWNMVRDQQLKSTEYLAIVREKAAREPLPELVESVLSNAGAALARYVPEHLKEEESRKFCAAAWDALKAAPQGDAQITWARAFLGSTLAREDIERAGRLVDGKDVIPGLTIDQDMQWAVAARFVAHGLPGAEERVARNVAADNSDRGQRAQIRCEVSAPSADTKATAWERIVGPGYGSLYLTGAAMGGFNWWCQSDLLVPYIDRYFTILPEIFRNTDKVFSLDFARAMMPVYRVERDVLARSEEVLREVGDTLPSLTRVLKEANDDLLRAIKCREFAAG